MKRSGIFFLVIIIGVTFLLWKGFGKKSPSTGDTSLAEEQSSARPVKQGEVSQASSAPAEEEAAASAPVQNQARPEPVLFQDKPSRLAITQNSHMDNTSSAGVFPSKGDALRVSSLWAEQSWKVWAGVSAVPKNAFQGNEGKDLGSVGSYELIQNSNIVSNERQFSSESPIAVFNAAENRAGLITGVVSVTLQDASDFESFVMDHGLSLKDAFPHLRKYYVSAGKEPVDLVLLMETLGKDPRVEKATLEIVTQNYAKK